MIAGSQLSDSVFLLLNGEMKVKLILILSQLGDSVFLLLKREMKVKLILILMLVLVLTNYILCHAC